MSINEHPFLGPEWVPLATVLHRLLSQLETGQFIGVDTYGEQFEYDPYRSPYIQVFRESDAFHAEVAGREQQIRPDQYAHLELLGWTAPADADVDVDDREGVLPNSYRIFDDETDVAVIVEMLLEALTMVFGIASSDFINFGENRADSVDRMGLLHRTGDDSAIFQLSLPEAEPGSPAKPSPESMPGLGAEAAMRPADSRESYPALYSRSPERVTAQQVLEILLGEGIVDAVDPPNKKVEPFEPMHRRGVRNPRTSVLGVEDVGWAIDVTSWSHPDCLDWLAHLAEVGGASPPALVVGPTWALTIRPEPGGRAIPSELTETICEFFESAWTPLSHFAAVGDFEGAWIDLKSWGPHAESMKAIIDWAATHLFSTNDPAWGDNMSEAQIRIEAAHSRSGRAGGVQQALDLVDWMATSDFVRKAGNTAVYALAVRDIISSEDYDLFTRAWRSKVGRIHSDDVPVQLQRDERDERYFTLE